MRLLTLVTVTLALAFATGCVDDAPVTPPSCETACPGQTNLLCNRAGACSCTIDGKAVGCQRGSGSAAPLELDDSPDEDADVSQLGSN